LPSPKTSSKSSQSSSPSPRTSSKSLILTRSSSRKISFISSDEEYEYIEEYLNGLSNEHIIMVAKYYNIYYKNPLITQLLNEQYHTIYQLTLIIKWIYGYIDSYIYDDILSHNVKNNTKQQQLEKYMNIQLKSDSFIFTKKRLSQINSITSQPMSPYNTGDDRSLWSRDKFIQDFQLEENVSEHVSQEDSVPSSPSTTPPVDSPKEANVPSSPLPHSGQRAECLLITNSEGDRRSPSEFGQRDSVPSSLLITNPGGDLRSQKNDQEDTPYELTLTIKPNNILKKKETISQRIYHLLAKLLRRRSRRRN
jgi:hypothetical protein